MELFVLSLVQQILLKRNEKFYHKAKKDTQSHRSVGVGLGKFNSSPVQKQLLWKLPCFTFIICHKENDKRK